MSTYRTEYVVTFHGEPMPATVTTDKGDALRYIAGGVEAGHPRAAYGIAHRTVTVGEWAPTTVKVAR